MQSEKDCPEERKFGEGLHHKHCKIIRIGIRPISVANVIVMMADVYIVGFREGSLNKDLE